MKRFLILVGVVCALCGIGCSDGPTTSAGSGGGGGDGGGTTTSASESTSSSVTTSESATTSVTTTSTACVPEDDDNDCSTDLAEIVDGQCITEHHALQGDPCSLGTCFYGNCIPSGMDAVDPLTMAGVGVQEFVASSARNLDQAVQPVCFTEPTTITGVWTAATCTDPQCLPDGDARLFSPTVTPVVDGVFQPDPNGVVLYQGFTGAAKPGAFRLLGSGAKFAYRVFFLLAPVVAEAGTCVYVSREMTPNNVALAIDVNPLPTYDGWWCTQPSDGSVMGCGPMGGPYPGVNKPFPWFHGIVIAK